MADTSQSEHQQSRMPLSRIRQREGGHSANDRPGGLEGDYFNGSGQDDRCLRRAFYDRSSGSWQPMLYSSVASCSFPKLCLLPYCRRSRCHRRCCCVPLPPKVALAAANRPLIAHGTSALLTVHTECRRVAFPSKAAGFIEIRCSLGRIQVPILYLAQRQFRFYQL